MFCLTVAKNNFFIILTVIFTGCCVGPDFKAPGVPKAAGYNAKPLPAETVAVPAVGQDKQKFMPGQEIVAQWWGLFHCEKMNKVLAQALANNPTLAQAQAALRQAQEEVNAQFGGVVYPKVDAGLSSVRQKISSAAQGVEIGESKAFTLDDASVQVSYLLDIFGGGRRSLEALRARVDYQRYQLEAARLTLTGNIIAAAIKEASLRAQIAAINSVIGAQEKQLKMLDQRFELGAVGRTNILAQRALLESNRALLPPLEKSLNLNRHYLAALVGDFPSQVNNLPEFYMADFTLPDTLPVSVPSALVKQRPDIAGAQALLHAACAQIGVATANMYPQITLSAAFGGEANVIKTIFSDKHDVWSLGYAVAQPIIEGGSLRARRRSAVAAYDQAMAAHKQVVLSAFQNVADVLCALDTGAKALRAQVAAQAAAQDSLKLAYQQFDAGAVSYDFVLDADNQYQQALINCIQAQALRFSDTAALFEALGGGWWNQKENL